MQSVAKTQNNTSTQDLSSIGSDLDNTAAQLRMVSDTVQIICESLQEEIPSPGKAETWEGELISKRFELYDSAFTILQDKFNEAVSGLESTRDNIYTLIKGRRNKV